MDSQSKQNEPTGDKKIREWFNELPEPIRTQAYRNTPPYKLEDVVSSVPAAILTAFPWEGTIKGQGRKYWEDIYLNTGGEL